MSMLKLLSPLFDRGWYLDSDNKVKCKGIKPVAESPWIHNKQTFICYKWHRIFWDLVSQKQMVHSNCQECYKVVIRPRTLEELNELLEYQQGSDLECKCGVEIRASTPALYGGYFYTRGIEQGRERYKEVKQWAESCWNARQVWADDPAMYPEPMKVILKLGCSEFEIAIGPSSKYQITDQQRHMEKKLDEAIEFDPYDVPGDPELAKVRTAEIWIDFAHSIGDMTYLKYTIDGKPIVREFDTYHEERKNENENNRGG